MLKIYQKIRNIDFLVKMRKRANEKQSQFYAQNRKQVLNHYRYLLKTIPYLYPRRLQQRSTYIQICYLFHESKIMDSIKQIKQRRQHLDTLVNEFKSGDYGNLGTYLPARQGQREYLRQILKDLSTKRIDL